jgi:hypothetical protein
MKTMAIALIAAATLAGCTASSTPEQAMQPAAGKPLTYDAHTMTEFDSAKEQANDYCHRYENERAVYVDRTLDSVHFECSGT